ncbi:hypothetical protein H2201_001835 [Coniosporium apollinis]|uniref:SMP domain-containing protein n=1 Tax=Coniosporium apollinis TaxID=61459 RepID=A0ABQ9P3A5_9PEZI|nr:hypothetical protein H2201_001835 [Coniosporium apollinis]
MSSKNSNTNNSGSAGGWKSTSMTQSDASRIQSSQATRGGDMSSSGFAARAQSAGGRNANTGAGGGKGAGAGEGAGQGK